MARSLALMVAVFMVTSCGGSSVPEEPAPTAKDDSLAFFRSVISTMGSCEQGGNAISKAASSNDMVALYRAAENLESACLMIPSALDKLEIPQTVGKKAHSEFKDAIEACKTAVVSKWDFAQKVQAAVEEPGSVAAQAALQTSREQVDSSSLYCGAALSVPPSNLGAKPEDFASR